jgi:arylsulfatase A-like enzyme
LNIKEWAAVEIRARTQDPIQVIGLDFNYIEGKWRGLFPFSFYRFRTTPLLTDGRIQTYRLLLDKSFGQEEGEERSLTELGIWFVSQPDEEAVSLDILSVRVLPKAYIYADASVGVKTVDRSDALRRTLFLHTPGKIEYKVRIPKAGRLDVGLGVLREDSPVTFKITASTSNEEGAVFFEETYANQEEWGQRSVDLSSMAGKTVRISLETDAEQSGEVALWAAPTISGMQENDKPNIVFYIIDGARADLMSVYGYNRRTTPFLERLAAEGAIFENAYSNSTWTKVSNPTFMTSLHHSVLGGYQSENNPLPDQAVTMAQHVHRVGYQTGVFTSNAYCGTMSGFDRGVDALREAEAEINSQSSKELQEDFWNWRKAYPGGPYWVHFQTTDIHPPLKPTAPFSGLFISPELRETFYDWELKLEKAHGRSRNLIDYPASAYEKAGINRKALFNAARDLHDETMAHNDYQIGKLVERLKASGEWENTLFIVAADHGGSPLALGLFDKETPYEGKILCSSSRTRIPLIIVWPERIAPGQRFSQPVSMIDMLPTILDFAELPMPEMMQGQSLAPLLLKEGSWEPRPVIFDEFYDYSGTLKGLIEVIDGRWGASLSINILPDDQEAPGNMRHRPSPLLLFDIWNDPHCLHSLHEKRPDLVKKYTKFLEAQWKAHQALAQHFTRSEDSPLTPEQLETLRSLGYIR